MRIGICSVRGECLLALPISVKTESFLAPKADRLMSCWLNTQESVQKRFCDPPES